MLGAQPAQQGLGIAAGLLGVAAVLLLRRSGRALTSRATDTQEPVPAVRLGAIMSTCIGHHGRSAVRGPIRRQLISTFL